MTRPLISVVIIAYNMAREIPRTVQSFLPPYQTGIEPHDVEIIVMENGSTSPVPKAVIEAWPDMVRYIPVEHPHPSPAKALNQGVAMARGDWVCPVIDGARMVSPGLLRSIHMCEGAFENPFIASLGFHLGAEVQQKNILNGYNQDREDALLQSIDWPRNPYRLFEISCLGESARGAWFKPIAESNAPLLKKSFYQSLGGYDEAFDIPGGGIVNLDFFKRAVEAQESQYVLLLSEASFHQYHGGVTTSRSVSEVSLTDASRSTWQVYADQYKTLRGKDFAVTDIKPVLMGRIRPEISKFINQAVNAESV